jgi:hypothetical protein
LSATEHLWGFGGLHGGLALALLTGAMRAEAGAMQLRQTTAHFVTPVRREHEIATRVLRSGSGTRFVAAEATEAGLVAAHADAIFGDSRGPFPAVAPSAPDAGSPGDHPVFSLPTELVPISRHLEIRPVGSARPFANGDEQQLTAWVRLVEDDEPPDELRLIVLMDSLAPAVTAAIAEIVAVPTLQLTVRPSVDGRANSSPWVLLTARSHLVTPDGWADEQLDAWSPDGTHIGTARQLRARIRAHPPGN